MDFILNEAFEDEFTEFSDKTTEEEYSENESDSFIENNDDKMFVCDQGGEQEWSFYKGIDNKNERVKFVNQNLAANPEKFDKDYFEDDEQPELFNPENSEENEFDSFENCQDLSSIFKNSLLRFNNLDNPFFCSIIYGIMHHELNGQNISLEKAEETLGKQFFIEMKLTENSIMLDHSISGFFNPCMLANNVLFEFVFF